MKNVKLASRLKKSVTPQRVSPRFQQATSSTKMEKVEDIPYRRVRFNASATPQRVSPRFQQATSSTKMEKVEDIPYRRVGFKASKMQLLPSFLSREEKTKTVEESRLALERWERRIECEDLMRQQKEESHIPANQTTLGDAMVKLQQETSEHQENNDEKKKLFQQLYLSRKIPFFSDYSKWKTCLTDNHTLDDYMEYLNASARSTPLFLSIPLATRSVLTTHVSIE